MEPWLGRHTYRRLAADRTVFARTYRIWLAILWAWVLGTVLVLVLSPGLQPRHLGLVWPHGPAARDATLYAALLCALILGMGLVLRFRARRGGTIPGQDTFSALLPTTPSERRWALAMAISAGVCEELFTRALLIAAGIALGLSPLVAAGIAVVLFGLAHFYQGVSGIVATTALGGMFAGLYLVSGSLLLPVVVHIVIDLRALLMVPAPSTTATATTAAAVR